MRLIYIITFSIITSSIFAQGDLPTGQIEVIKDFEVRLLETKKISIIPQPIALDSTMRSYDYVLAAPSPAIDYVVPEIKPLSINPEKKPAYYPLFAKAGYGSPNSLLGQFSYDHRQNDVLQWGIDLRHLSANNKKIPLQKFSDTEGRINGSYSINDNLKLDGYINGHFETVYFYGAEQIPSDPDLLKRYFNRYDAHFTLTNLGGEKQKIKYKILLQHLFDKDDYGSHESAVRFGGEVETSIGAKSFPLGLKVLEDASTLKDTREQSINNTTIEPYFQFYLGRFKAHLGGIALLNKEANEVLPAIELSYPILNNRLTLLAGWQGEILKNNFHYLSTLNPYINTRIPEIGNNISRRIFAGVKGANGKLQYEFRGEYSMFTQMAFFLQDENSPEQFNPIYDDGSFEGYEGSARFEALKNIFLHARIWQRFYNLDNLDKPFHMPSAGVDGELSYSGGKDIYHVSLIFHGENGVPYLTPGGTEGNLDPLIDLNLHADYYVTSSIGAFLELNNLLGNNRERWYAYPSFGFNAKAGVLFRL